MERQTEIRNRTSDSDSRDTQKVPVPIYNKTLFDIMPGGIVAIASNDGRILFVSPGIKKLLGYGEGNGAVFADMPAIGTLMYPEDSAFLKNDVTRGVRANGSAVICCRMKKKDGMELWVKQYALLKKSSRWGEYYLLHIQDYTETKNALAQAESARKKLNAFVNNIPAAVIWLNIAADISVEYANDTFYRITGFSAEELDEEGISSNFCRIICAQDKQFIQEDIRRFVNAQQPKDSGSFDFRITRKDGELRWIRVNASRPQRGDGNCSVLQCIVSDVTDEKTMAKKAAISEERYRIISEQTREIVYDWDISKGFLHHSHVYEQIFGYDLPDEFPVELLLTTDIVHIDDKQTLMKVMNMVTSGTPYAEAEYRILKNDGSYVWCRNRMSTIFDENHRPLSIVGVITDIDEQKKRTEALMEKARQDSLTGLLNRMTVQEQIFTCLQQDNTERRHAFFLIDIDKFKDVNDTLGHIAGDFALTEISARLRASFRENDITGRLGGDEFAVFMKDIGSIDSVKQKAKQLNASCRKSFVCEGKKYSVSISIGVALYPEHGTTFHDLYRCADKALYRSKGKGRNCFTLYSPE